MADAGADSELETQTQNFNVMADAGAGSEIEKSDSEFIPDGMELEPDMARWVA